MNLKELLISFVAAVATVGLLVWVGGPAEGYLETAFVVLAALVVFAGVSSFLRRR